MKDLWEEAREISINRCIERIGKFEFRDTEKHLRNRTCLSSAVTLSLSLFNIATSKNKQFVEDVCGLGLALLECANSYNDSVVRTGMKPDEGWACAVRGELNFWFNFAKTGQIILKPYSEGLVAALTTSKTMVSYRKPHYAGLLAIQEKLQGVLPSFDRGKYSKYIRDDSGVFFWDLMDLMNDPLGFEESFNAKFSSLVRGAPMNTGDGTIGHSERVFASFVYHKLCVKEFDFYAVNEYVKLPSGKNV